MQNGCVKVVNELLIKIINAPTKKTKVMRSVAKAEAVNYGFRLGVKPMIEACILLAKETA